MAKLKEKNDSLLWTAILLLPFFAFFVSWFRVGSAPAFLTFVNEQFAFPFVQNIINDVWELVFGAELQLAGYISYLVCVEVIKCFFNVLVFIPCMAQFFVDMFIGFARGGKR